MAAAEGSDYRRRLRLDERRYEDLLRDLDDACASARPRPDGRRTQRLAFQIADVGLSIEHAHGNAAHFLVYGRNISSRGISVLHGGYLHVGTTCHVSLERLCGDRMSVAGEVRYCRLVTGACHEIGIRFAREIDPGMLVGVGDAAAGRTPASAPTKRRRKLDGRLLLADPFLPDLVLLKYQLGLHGPDITLATTPGALLDAIKREHIDVVISGFSLTSDEGVRTLLQLRSIGFEGPVLALSAETDSKALLRAQAAGATEIVPKPCNLDMLIALLAESLGGGELPSTLYSTVADQPGMPVLISRYVDTTRRLAEDAKSAYNRAAWAELELICAQLRGSGCGFGFQNVTTTAVAAMRELRTDRGSQATRIAVARLIQCCRALATGELVESAA